MCHLVLSVLLLEIILDANPDSLLCGTWMYVSLAPLTWIGTMM